MTGELPALADNGDICVLASMEDVTHVFHVLFGTCLHITADSAADKMHATPSFDGHLTHDGEGVIGNQIRKI